MGRFRNGSEYSISKNYLGTFRTYSYRTAHSTARYGPGPLPSMGAGSSVRPTDDSTNPRQVKKDDADVDGRDNSASSFDVFVDLLASNYHNHRLVGVGSPLSEGTASPVVDAVSPTASTDKGLARVVPSLRSKLQPPPLPRAERMRLSREQQLRQAVGGDEEGVNKKGHEERVQVYAAAAASLDKGMAGPAQSQKMEPLGTDELTGANTRKWELPEQGHGQFVKRGEMVVLARDLGYDITPAQATRLFDMLDPLGQGRIAKGDLLKHVLPLIRRVECFGPTENGPRERRSSTFKPPRRPRPTCPPPGTAAPSRPSGDPPPNAKRWVSPMNTKQWVSPAFYGDRTASAATATLRLDLSSNVSNKRPPHFWVTARGTAEGGDVAGSRRSFDNGVQTVGRDHVDEDLDLRDVVAEGSTIAHRHGGVNQTEGGGRTDHANREQAKGRSVRAEKGTSAGNSGDVVVVTPPASPTCEGSEGEKQRNAGSDEGNPRNPDKRAAGKLVGKILTPPSASSGNSNVGCHSTSNESLVGRSTSRATEETRERRRTTNAAVVTPAPSLGDALAGKDVLTWTAADVRVWLRALPRGLAAFAKAKAFSDDSVDGKRLAALTMSDLKKKEFHHAKFRAKVPTALWVEIKRIQPISSSAPAVAAPPASSRFFVGQTIADEAARTPLCTVTQFVGRGAFGELYKVLWTGVGADWGETFAMKIVRLADTSVHERDEYRVLLVEEILTAVRVKPHPHVVNVRFAHIMGFCSENEEYLCFENFVTGTDLGSLILQDNGELYNGTTAEVQGRLLSYAIQLARGLGHIHRCGVLHQDIKSANVMVSDAGQILITDFGFATVGHFGPPPPQRPMCTGAFRDASPSLEEATLIPAAIGAKLDTDLAGKELVEEDTSAVPTYGPVSMGSTVRDDSRRLSGPPGLIPEVVQRIENTNSIGDHASKREGSDTEGGVVGESQANNAGFGLEPVAQVQECQDEKIEAGKGHLARGANKERSHLIAGCTANDVDNGTGRVVQAVKKVEQLSKDIETVPGRNSVLFGTLKGFTPRYQSPEVSRIMARKEKSLKSHDGSRDVRNGVTQNSTALPARDNVADGQPHYTHRSDMWAAGVVILEMYAGGLAALPAGRGENAGDLLEALVERSRSDLCQADGVQREGCCATSKGGDHDDVNVSTETGGRLRAGGKASGNDVGRRRRGEKLRVDMPEEVLKVLRDVFKREAEDRPVSMEAVAARLSQALGRLLEKNLVVVPCPSSDSPSLSSLCEQTPAYAETEENHAKLGRLHMWLGKALFLKGEDRREQALQEYREGVRVLQESKADQGSASMALFRWYLGKALLEAGEIEEALPHLAEAVSIDPENAKYRHTLGLAKCATGDEAGAREDLLEAALLDEEDAEDRYQLRMQRQAEASKTLEKCSNYQDSEEGARQGSPSPPENEATDKFRAASTAISMAGAPSASLRCNSSRRQALEYASSPQTYALERLMEYRTGRGALGVDGDFGGIGRRTVDAGAMALGDKALRDAGRLSEVQARRFSIGDEIVFGKDEHVPVKATDPLRCYPSTLDGAGGGGGRTYAIDSFLSGEQASLCFRGETYTATTRLESNEDGPNAGRSYHLIRMGFERDSLLAPTAASTSAAITRRRSLAASTPLNADEERNMASIGNENTGEVPVISSGRTQTDSSCQPSEPPRDFIGPKFMRRCKYLTALRAFGRAAMVGFHTRLSGALRDFMWGAGELVLVADSIPSGCLSLREALCGSLYRGSGFTSHGNEEKCLGTESACQRILTIARQTAAAISHCHHRGVLLQDITPSCVRVTPQWNALLCPNYVHAREGGAWTTMSVREPLPQAVRSTATQRKTLRPQRASLSSCDELLTAPFSDATRPDYQSPEIMQIRRASPSHVRVSSRALRRLRLSPPPEKSGEKTLPSPSLQSIRPEGASGKEANHGHELYDIRNREDDISDDVVGPCDDNDGGGHHLSSTTRVEDKNGGAARVTINSRWGNYARDGDLSPPEDSTCGSGGQNVSSLGVPTGSELPTVTPCTSDIWAWALIVLEMFSDERWPSDSGQEGLIALEALLRRRMGVDTWTIEDVVSWLRDVGLWSENTEREIRAFKINGRQLLIPTCRRDIMEKLGLFITDGELSHKLWMNITGGLQRWTMPPQLAHILRRCLADRPEDRFSTMEEVCTMLRGGTADVGGGDCSTVPTVDSTVGSKDQSLDRRRTGMILNNIALCLANEGETEEAKRHYKMALLASEEIPEVHYNLGRLYSTSAFNKHREAQQSFEAAAALMAAEDPRRRFSSDHARAAERKSNYYQSEQVMRALSGKYNNSVSPTESRGTTRASREPRGSRDGDHERRSSATPEKTSSPPWNSSTKKSTGSPPNSSGLPASSHRSKTTRKSSLSPV